MMNGTLVSNDFEDRNKDAIEVEKFLVRGNNLDNEDIFNLKLPEGKHYLLTIYDDPEKHFQPCRLIKENGQPFF